MGLVIQPKILHCINNVNYTNLADLLNDETIFELNKTNDNIF